MQGLELWNTVSETDPKYTKSVNKGAYKLTDIDSTWNIKRATSLWGPYGGTWGLKEFSVNVLYLEGKVTGVYIQGRFSYPDGEFDIAADMPYDPKGEVLKKLQTMCIGKALSRLGFSADVYEGKFDDSAYVKEMEDKYARTDAGNGSRAPGGTTASSVSDTKPVEKTTKKHVKYPEPDPNASGILGSLAQKYMDLVANNEQYAGKVVSFTKVCHAVYDRFGKYPTKIESVPTLMDAVSVDMVLEENDFLQGL